MNEFILIQKEFIVKMVMKYIKNFVCNSVVILILPFFALGQEVDIRVETPDESVRWGSYQTSSTTNPDFIVDTPHYSPEWALLQRELLRSASIAAEVYYERYFDEQGYLLTDLRWGANDGPDDAIENVNRWPNLYALGGSERVLEMYKKVYEGHVRQMSEPLRNVNQSKSSLYYIFDGMYYKEFLTRADWMHISESLMVFNLMGLGDPYDVKFQNRTERFAGFYMGGDPGARNYDPEHKIIRSMYNGSRGPHLQPATSVDWVGDVSEIRNRYAAGHGEESYEEFLFHFKDYHDVVGDNHQNLMSTTLGFNAYALTGDEKYRDWVLEYVDAWYERMEENDWVIPSTIALDGTIGGTSGKWYGGAYGWSFTIDHQTPPASRLTDRERTRWGFVGFMNAYVLTGDDKYLQAWRNQHDVIYDAGRMIDGVYHTPRMYGNPEWSREGFTDEDDWYSFRPYNPEAENMLQIYYLSMNEEDREHLSDNPWLEFLEGSNPNYALNSMRADLVDVKKRAKALREDTTSPDMRLVDDPMGQNPASITSLIRLMEGGLYESSLARRSPASFSRLRYFDPVKRRPGVPDDVAALVRGMTDESVTVSVVNLNPVEIRPVIIQGGGYGEHQFINITHNGESTPIDSSTFQLVLEPGSGTTLEIEMNRFANQPAMDFPWYR